MPVSAVRSTGFGPFIEKAAIWPNVPTFWSVTVAPYAWEASSSKSRPCSSANWRSWLTAVGRPQRWIAITAAVFSVMRSSTSATETLPVSSAEAADKGAAAKVGQAVDVDSMRPPDLIVCGSVAVNHRGVRLGKGAGYSDIEVALLREAGLIGPETTIVTTVHDLQLIDDDLPETPHDFSVDIIVTPTTVIRCEKPRRPSGLLWNDLPAEKIAAIPALAARLHQQSNT